MSMINCTKQGNAGSPKKSKGLQRSQRRVSEVVVGSKSEEGEGEKVEVEVKAFGYLPI